MGSLKRSPRTTFAVPHEANEPKTPDEWKLAVDAAEFLLLIDSARKYGLITGGPAANVTRCEEILRRGAKMGIKPGRTDALIRKFMQ